MKFGVVRAEVLREPLLQFGRKAGLVEVSIVFHTIHDVAKLIEGVRKIHQP